MMLMVAIDLTLFALVFLILMQALLLRAGTMVLVNTVLHPSTSDLGTVDLEPKDSRTRLARGLLWQFAVAATLFVLSFIGAIGCWTVLLVGAA